MSVRKRGNHWHYDFQIKGVRYRGAIPEARTKAHAQQTEAALKVAVYEGRYGKSEVPTDFVEFTNQTYLPWAKANKKTFRDDVMHSKALCEAFKGKALNEISPMLIEAHKRNRLVTQTKIGRKRQPATVNRELAVLSKIFSTALDYGLISHNPCQKIKRLRVENIRNRYVSVEEEEALLKACTGLREHLQELIIVAIQTGMRKGEILTLKWSDVDFERNLILINQSKSGKPRTVPMSSEVRQILKDKAQTCIWVFTHPYYPERRLTEFKRAWEATCQEAGIEDLHFHDLRHTAATRMAEAGTDAFTIAAILGHSTIQMSARYTHATDRGKRQAVENLGRYGKNVTSLSQAKSGRG